jgi:hypothetical protein
MLCWRILIWQKHYEKFRAESFELRVRRVPKTETLRVIKAEFAVKNNKGFANSIDAKDGYFGFSKDGKIKIEFYYTEGTGAINSFFPSLRP